MFQSVLILALVVLVVAVLVAMAAAGGWMAGKLSAVRACEERFSIYRGEVEQRLVAFHTEVILTAGRKPVNPLDEADPSGKAPRESAWMRNLNRPSLEDLAEDREVA